MNRTAWYLAVLLLAVAAVPAGAGIIIWTVEHYMAITPADWPTPGGLIDHANDIACALILLPSASIGRFAVWLVFCPVPVLIELRRRRIHRAVLYLFGVMLPYSSIDVLYQNERHAALPSALLLALVLIAPPFLIASWSSLASNVYEKRLIRANLIVLWLTFCAADIMLGLEIHGNDCKPGITRAMTRL